jgi:hypothetical protein
LSVWLGAAQGQAVRFHAEAEFFSPSPDAGRAMCALEASKARATVSPYLNRIGTLVYADGSISTCFFLDEQYALARRSSIMGKKNILGIWGECPMFSPQAAEGNPNFLKDLKRALKKDDEHIAQFVEDKEPFGKLEKRCGSCESKSGNEQDLLTFIDEQFELFADYERLRQHAGFDTGVGKNLTILRFQKPFPPLMGEAPCTFWNGRTPLESFDRFCTIGRSITISFTGQNEGTTICYGLKVPVPALYCQVPNLQRGSSSAGKDLYATFSAPGGDSSRFIAEKSHTNVTGLNLEGVLFGLQGPLGNEKWTILGMSSMRLHPFIFFDDQVGQRVKDYKDSKVFRIYETYTPLTQDTAKEMAPKFVTLQRRAAERAEKKAAERAEKKAAERAEKKAAA